MYNSLYIASVMAVYSIGATEGPDVQMDIKYTLPG